MNFLFYLIILQIFNCVNLVIYFKLLLKLITTSSHISLTNILKILLNDNDSKSGILYNDCDKLIIPLLLIIFSILLLYTTNI